ncbi:MAG: hypothetical protein ACQGVK_21050 [Myxococcota bacterium]
MKVRTVTRPGANGRLRARLVGVMGALAMVLGTACAHTSGGIAPSTVPLEAGSYEVLGPVGGRDCVYSLLGLIPLSNGNETRTALQDALARRPGTTALIQVTSDTYRQFWVVVARTCTQVYGTAVRTR